MDTLLKISLWILFFIYIFDILLSLLLLLLHSKVLNRNDKGETLLTHATIQRFNVQYASPDCTQI